MLEALVKLAMGFESDIFSWDKEGDCFDWRVEEGRDTKGKGRAIDEETVRGRIWGSDIESSERSGFPFESRDSSGDVLMIDSDSSK